MEYLPYIAGFSFLVVGALLVEAYHTCDDCHSFDWSVRFRKGERVRAVFQSHEQAQLCDKCMGARLWRTK